MNEKMIENSLISGITRRQFVYLITVINIELTGEHWLASQAKVFKIFSLVRIVQKTRWSKVASNFYECVASQKTILVVISTVSTKESKIEYETLVFKYGEGCYLAYREYWRRNINSRNLHSCQSCFPWMFSLETLLVSTKLMKDDSI